MPIFKNLPKEIIEKGIHVSHGLTVQAPAVQFRVGEGGKWAVYRRVPKGSIQDARYAKIVTGSNPGTGTYRIKTIRVKPAPGVLRVQTPHLSQGTEAKGFGVHKSFRGRRLGHR
jgi:hypothetical protein